MIGSASKNKAYRQGRAREHMPTLEEIARIAHVSRSTVSRVINNDPNVSDRTRQRVEEVIRQANFQPNRAARSLAGGRTRILGLVIPMGVSRLFTDPFFPILIQSVTSSCNAHDHTLMLWLEEPEYERRMVSQILQNDLIDGVIVSSSLIEDPLVRSLSSSSMPFIVIGRTLNDPTASYVDVDNVEGARRAVTHLFQRGYRKIAAITGPQDMIAGIDRLEGYKKAHQEWGLPPNPDWIVDGGFSEDIAYEAMQQLLTHEIDAVFTHSDIMASGAMRAVKKAGLRIPEDVAVVGFDDMPFAARLEPPLTTIRQPIQKTGAIAVETLIESIRRPGSPPRRIFLPAELVIRSSS